MHDMAPALAHMVYNEPMHQYKSASLKMPLIINQNIPWMQISVCGLELWPEARKCEDDWRLGQGVLFGTLLMGWTLYIGI